MTKKKKFYVGCTWKVARYSVQASSEKTVNGQVYVTNHRRRHFSPSRDNKHRNFYKLQPMMAALRTNDDLMQPRSWSWHSSVIFDKFSDSRKGLEPYSSYEPHNSFTSPCLSFSFQCASKASYVEQALRWLLCYDNRWYRVCPSDWLLMRW